MTINDDEAEQPTFVPHNNTTMESDDQQQLATSILGPTSMLETATASSTKNNDNDNMDIEKENDDHNNVNGESLPPFTHGKIMDEDTTMDDSTMTDDSSSLETTTPLPSPRKVLENTPTKKMKHTVEGEEDTTLPSSDSNNDKNDDSVIEKKMDNVKSTVDAFVEKRLGEDLDSALDSLHEVSIVYYFVLVSFDF